jgi:hypothetical protein
LMSFFTSVASCLSANLFAIGEQQARQKAERTRGSSP